MKKFALILTCIALGAAYVFEGDLIHCVLLMAVMFCLIAPASLIMGIWMVASWGQWRPGYSTFWRVTGISAFCLILSGVASCGMRAWRIWQTHDYVSRAVAVLDEHRARTGHYPDTLPVDAVGRPPKWLRSPGSYAVIGEEFRFQYWDPAGMMDGYEFNSVTRSWPYFD